GDSFFIRAEFGTSHNNNGSSLKFNKGDILYVDNTLYDGIPCQYWHAWKLDLFGRPIQSGHIPSKYNAECEMFRRYHFDMNNNHVDNKRMFSSIRHIFQRLLISNKSNDDDDDTRLLASFSYMPNVWNDPNSIDNIQAYRQVKMIKQTTINRQRPVIIIGPYNHLIVECLENRFPALFRCCPIKTKQSMGSIFDEKINEHYICCSRGEDDGNRFISLKMLTQISDQGLHPVITIIDNDGMEEFFSKQIYPILIEIRFRTAKQMKTVVNKRWNHQHQYNMDRITSFSMAKNIHDYHRKLSKQFENIEHFQLNIENNNSELMDIITKINVHVHYEQNKPIWNDA
ncbi:hypothetical protein BLA29_005709, partial [Euroglyphus maynei]